MSEKWNLWKRNVIDKYKNWPTETIKKDLQKTAHRFAVCMEHWQGDFNISTLIRNSNAFNVERVFYIGKKRFDRRGAVGTHHYVDLVFLDGDYSKLVELKNTYSFVEIDNNLSNTQKLSKFDWNKLKKPPLFFFGEEGIGLTPEILNLSDYTIEIAQHGSVRSLNAGTSSGIVMYAYVNFLRNSTNQSISQIEKYGEIGSELNESFQLDGRSRQL